ncbi:formin homology 2 domain-containing protein, putative, partial [Eimeria tenella]
RPADAFPNILTALDMRMRIHQNRDCEPVQDLVLALGCVQHQGGRLREALEAYKEVYFFRSKTLGPQHPDTLTVQQLLSMLEADLFRAVERKELQRSSSKELLPLFDFEEIQEKKIKSFQDLPSSFRQPLAPSLEAFKRQQTAEEVRALPLGGED